MGRGTGIAATARESRLRRVYRVLKAGLAAGNERPPPGGYPLPWLAPGTKKPRTMPGLLSC